MRRLVLLLALVVGLSACGREASVDLASGDDEASGNASTVDVPEEPEDDSFAYEEAVESSEGAGSGSAAADEATTAPKPVATTRAGTAPQPAATGGSSPGYAGGGSPPNQGATTPPNQGIAVGEPNPNDPDGCPECPVSPPTDDPATAPGDGGYTNPAPGQDDVRAREWESAEVQDDDQTVLATWWSGVEPCYVLDHVDVVEEADRVVITLYEGSQPDFDGACTEQAVRKTTEVRVPNPVAGRTIVDGAKK